VKNPVEKMAQGLFGYTSFDAVQFFETIKFKPQSKEVEIPFLRYRLYQYVIAINHFNDEMFFIENKIEGLKSEILEIENIIQNKDVALYPFEKIDEETSNLTDEEYRDLVELAKNTVSVEMFSNWF
jgi:anthranilate synthase component 1